MQVGLTKENIAIDYGLIPMKEIAVKGAFGHLNSSWSGVLKMMESKQLNVKPLITHKFKFDDWEAGFDQAADLNCVKVLLHP
ncbi:L-threonine 3-dehydrogenase [bioreactor metagenome]|uniref:L-threonine 3-dehydrogenase n=1 Tax=bioreactor metagenome TaxID=1076179 RepID=A0A645J3D3_9ZZZZ